MIPLIGLLLSILVIFVLIPDNYPNHKQSAMRFSGTRALEDLKFQLSLGPRIPKSSGHSQFLEWLQGSLENEDWTTEIQAGDSMGHPIKNVIAKRGRGDTWIIFGAHYDTRMYADKDPDLSKRISPVPGANDGASGVSILLELARVIPDGYPIEIWLVFFDAEDNGNIEGWDWILGSRYFVEHLNEKPDAMILLDMVGDSDLNIYMEKNSNPELMAAIWGQAASIGYGRYFIPTYRYSILDDHIPFIQAGIPSVDIIDFDYPYHHTVEDTLDKVSSQSLQIVGETLLEWLDSLEK